MSGPVDGEFIGRCALCDEAVLDSQETVSIEGNLCHKDCADEEGFQREDYDDVPL